MSKLQKALCAIMDEVGYVQKDARNDHHKYKYASADAVLTKVRAACTKHGVAITNTTSELVAHEGKLCVVRISQTYSLGAESATFQGIGGGSDGQDKGPMKASTAALKYLLSNAFNISWGDDPEATDENGKSTTSKKAPRSKAKTPPPKGTLELATELASRVKNAASLASLEGCKGAIKGMPEGDAKDQLKQAYGARKKELHAIAEKETKKAAKAAGKEGN